MSGFHLYCSLLVSCVLRGQMETRYLKTNMPNSWQSLRSLGRRSGRRMQGARLQWRDWSEVNTLFSALAVQPYSLCKYSYTLHYTQASVFCHHFLNIIINKQTNKTLFSCLFRHHPCQRVGPWVLGRDREECKVLAMAGYTHPLPLPHWTQTWS